MTYNPMMSDIFVHCDNCLAFNVQTNSIMPWPEIDGLPTMISSPTKYELMVAACVSVDEFIAFRNDFFVEVGYSSIFHKAAFELARDVSIRRPPIRDQIAKCLDEPYRTILMKTDVFKEHKELKPQLQLDW